MPFAVACPGCRTPMLVKDVLAGKQVKCPKCGQVLVVPKAPAPAPPVVTADRPPTGGAPKSVALAPRSSPKAAASAPPPHPPKTAPRGRLRLLILVLLAAPLLGSLAAGGAWYLLYGRGGAGAPPGPLARADDERKPADGDGKDDPPAADPIKDPPHKDKSDPPKDNNDPPHPIKDPPPPPIKDPPPPEPKPKPGSGYALSATPDAEGKCTKDGALTADDLREDGYPYKLLLARLEAGKSYRLELKSKDFDAYLRLLSPSGDFLAGDHNGAGDRDALVRVRPASSGVAGRPGRSDGHGNREVISWLAVL